MTTAGTTPTTRHEVHAVPTPDGALLHATVDGEATAPVTVVLAHGWTLAQAAWDDVAALLAPDVAAGALRLVRYDQRGHGRSTWGGTDPVSIDLLGEDLAAVLAALAPTGPVVLGGHSMGGMTIMALAERHPRLFTERIVGVALIATSAGDVMAQGLQRAVLSHRNPTVNVLGRLAHWQPEFVDRTRRLGANVMWAFVRQYSFGDRSVDPAIVDLVDRSIAATKLDVLTSFANTLSTHDRRAALAGLSHCEVVVIGATDDRMIPYEHSEVIAAEIPGAELVTLEGAGHMAMLEQPGELDAALLELLRRCTDRSQVLRRLRPRTPRTRERRGLRRSRRRA